MITLSRARSTAALLLVPALLGCGRVSGDAASGAPPPPSPAALAAIVARPGADRVRLARALDRLFAAGDDDGQTGHTAALVVEADGHIVAERYATGVGPATRLDGGAIGQTIATLVVGMLVADGRLALDVPVPLPAWQRPGDPRGEITLRQLLQQRSGLADEAGDLAMMRDGSGRDAMATAAEQQPLAAVPGQHWHDTIANAVIAGDLIAAVLAPDGDANRRHDAVDAFLHARLMQPLALGTLAPGYDRAGTWVAGLGTAASARDFARIGQLLVDKGRVSGTPIVPAGWLAFMARPQAGQPGYGAGLWLNRPTGSGGAPLLFSADGPHDLVAALGGEGQMLLVWPRRHLVVVRLGRTAPAQVPALRNAMAELVGCFR